MLSSCGSRFSVGVCGNNTYLRVCHWGHPIIILPTKSNYFRMLWQYTHNSLEFIYKSISPIQAAQIQLHLDTSLVLVIRYRQPFAPIFHPYFPGLPRFFTTHQPTNPTPHFPTCWTFVTLRLDAVHQAAVAAVRLTHNLQNNLNSPTQSSYGSPLKTPPLRHRHRRPFSQSLSQSVGLGECVNCLV